MPDLFVSLTISRISCSYYLFVRHHGWFHKVAIHHEICMVNRRARVTRPKEDVRASPPGNMLLSEDNKHKRYQTLPQCRNQSIWWIAGCQAKWTIYAIKEAHHNLKISTARTPYINPFTTVPSQCEPDKIVMKRFLFVFDIKKALIVLQQLFLNAQNSRKSHTLLLDRPHLTNLRPLAVHLQLTLWSEKISLYLLFGNAFPLALLS